MAMTCLRVYMYGSCKYIHVRVHRTALTNFIQWANSMGNGDACKTLTAIDKVHAYDYVVCTVHVST
jgi:hypothetical protein